MSDDASRTDSTPLSELRDRVEGRRGRRTGRADATSSDGTEPASGSPFSDLGHGGPTGERPADDPFESVEVDAVDTDALWDAVVDAEAPPSPPPEDAAEPAAADGLVEEHVVDKREFCQRCAYFTAPPEVACTHEGTAIVELVDDDRFCVRNCPKVEDDDEERFTAELTGE